MVQDCKGGLKRPHHIKDMLGFVPSTLKPLYTVSLIVLENILAWAGTRGGPGKRACESANMKLDWLKHRVPFLGTPCE